jgi:tetratricopeptide (TPR) repeat protein
MKHVTHTLLVLVAVLPAWSCGESRNASNPAVAPDACSVALAPSTTRDANDRDIVRLQERARRELNANLPLEQLGYRYVARARSRNDSGEYVLALKTAECLASKDPNDMASLLLRGHALHQLHRFTEAEQIARQLVAKRGLVLDFGLLGDALLEQGRVAEAADAYQKMMDLKPFYQSYVRAAHLRWLKGDVDGAIETVRLAIAAASPRDPDSIAWAYTRLAIYETQRNRLRAAGQAIESALQHRPGYAAALLARGRMLLVMERPDEARSVLLRAAEMNPLPEYQWALADAMRLEGRHKEADIVEQRLAADGERSDPRTLALFLATRRTAADRAVALAREEMGVRADVFTLDSLAWALAAAGRIHEADPLMTRALAEGTEDGRLFFHAAFIADAAGRLADARRWLARAETLQTTLLPSELAELDAIRTRISPRQEK